MLGRSYFLVSRIIMRFIGLSGKDKGKKFANASIHYVYALYFMNECVYIGLTNDVDCRSNKHRKDKMFDEVKVVTSDIDRSKMKIQETALIRKHQPKYNRRDY